MCVAEENSTTSSSRALAEANREARPKCDEI